MIALGWLALVAIALALAWKVSAERTDAMTRPGSLLRFRQNDAVVLVVQSRRPCLAGWRAVCEVVESPYNVLKGFDVVVTPRRIRDGFIVPYTPPELAPILQRVRR